MARKGRGLLSAIERLPDECGPIITWAATELQNRERTQTEIYQEFFAKMQALQAEHKGELEFTIPSFSAFNRYSIKLAMMTRRLEDTREIAATISKRFDAQSSDDLTLIAAEAIKTLIFELLSDAGESGMAPIAAMQLATALKMASQAQSVSTQRRATVAKEFKADVEKAVDTVVKAKGMSADTADAIKAQILGVRAN